MMEDFTSLTESITVNDIYADGIGAVENLGTCFRIIYFTYARPIGIAGPTERIVVAKLIRPMTSLLNRNGPLAAWVRQHPLQRNLNLMLHS